MANPFPKHFGQLHSNRIWCHPGDIPGTAKSHQVKDRLQLLIFCRCHLHSILSPQRRASIDLIVVQAGPAETKDMEEFGPLFIARFDAFHDNGIESLCRELRALLHEAPIRCWHVCPRQSLPHSIVLHDLIVGYTKVTQFARGCTVKAHIHITCDELNNITKRPRR